MIDENGDYVTKPKTTITVETLCKYNEIVGQQPNKQKNKQTASETQKMGNIQAEKKDILTNRRTCKLILDTRKER